MLNFVWGDLNPSDQVSGNVDYSPWLCEEAPTYWYS